MQCADLAFSPCGLCGTTFIVDQGIGELRVCYVTEVDELKMLLLC